MVRHAMFKTNRRLPAFVSIPQALGIFVCCVALVMLFCLGKQIIREFDNLNMAQVDNVQWSLAQVEIELLMFAQAEIVAHPDDPASMSELHKRFDIYYSRVMNVDQMAGFRIFRPIHSLSSIYNM